MNQGGQQQQQSRGVDLGSCFKIVGIVANASGCGLLPAPAWGGTPPRS